jgi:hypothetical protein
MGKGIKKSQARNTVATIGERNKRMKIFRLPLFSGNIMGRGCAIIEEKSA